MHFLAGGPQREIARPRAPHPRGVPLLAAGVGRRIHFARYNQIMASSAPPSALPSAIDRARKIKIILFDVDGVLTDGTIWLVPAASVAVSSPETLARPSETQGRAGLRPP